MQSGQDGRNDKGELLIHETLTVGYTWNVLTSVSTVCVLAQMAMHINGSLSCFVPIGTE